MSLSYQVVERLHPYSDNCNQTRTVSGPSGTVRIRAHFTQIDVETAPRDRERWRILFPAVGYTVRPSLTGAAFTSVEQVVTLAGCQQVSGVDFVRD